MISVLAITSAVFVSNASDFLALSSSVKNYLTHNIDLSDQKIQNISGVYLDCRGFTINSSTQFVNTIVNSKLIDCNFELRVRFAEDVTNTEFHNSSIQYVANTTSPAIAGIMSNSLLAGFRFLSNDPIVMTSYFNTYVGCYVTNYLDQFGDMSGLAEYGTSDTIANTFITSNMLTRNANNVGGIFASATNLTIKNARVWVTISQQLSSRTYVGGICATGTTMSISNTDIVVIMDMDEMDGFIGGMVGQMKSGAIVTTNVSITEEFYFATTNASSTNYAIGGMVGQCTYYSNKFVDVSVFATVHINSTQAQRTVYGGMVGDFDMGTDNQISRAYVFGYVQLNTLVNCMFGGLVAEATGVEMQNSSVNLDFWANLGSNSFVGGLAGEVQINATVSDCQMLGTMNCALDITGREYFALGGLVGYTCVSKLSYCFTNADIVITTRQISSYSGLAVGLLIGQIYNNTEIEHTFGNGSLKADFGSTTASNAQVGLMAGFCNFSKLRYVHINGSMDLQFTGESQMWVGVLLGFSSGATIYAAFVTGKFTLRGTCYAGSIVGVLHSVSTLENISIAVEAVSDKPLPFYGFDDGFSGISTNTVLIDCSLGSHAESVYCKTKDFMQSTSALTYLGSNFAIDAQINNNYPYLVNEVAPKGTKYVLPASGHQAQGSYFVDSQGLPFPTMASNVCRGACYGKFESPAVISCTSTIPRAGNAFCTNTSRAQQDFPKQSCLSQNAECNNGCSVCKPDSELINLACVYKCAGCSMGRCEGSKCVCDPYYYNTNCSVYKCDEVTPQCFGYSHMVCQLGNKCGCDDPQYYISGSNCLLGCPGLLASHGECIGNKTANCVGQWVSVSGGYCNGCDEGYVLEGDKCVDYNSTCFEGRCKHGRCEMNPSAICYCNYFWSGSTCEDCLGFGDNCDMDKSECDATCNGHGTCFAYHSGECLCFDGHAGRKCDSCESGYFFASCQSAESCGITMCSSHGKCIGNQNDPACQCNDYWAGDKCDTCNGYGKQCNQTADQCRETTCPNCSNPLYCKCQGEYFQPTCACVSDRFGADCGMLYAQCSEMVCGSHGTCYGGIAPLCSCGSFWTGENCQTCQGYGANCSMSKQECKQRLCDNGGECQGFGNATVCSCYENFDIATNCSQCVKGYVKDGVDCVEKQLNVGAIVGWTCGALVILAAALGLTYWFVRKQKIRNEYKKLGASMPKKDEAARYGATTL